MSTTIVIPDVPVGLELKRDRAIAALVIKKGIGLQDAAEQIEQLMAQMQDTIESKVADLVGSELDGAPETPKP